MHAEQEDWQAVVVDAKQILAVNPLTPEPHQWLAKAGEKLGDREVAIEGLQTLTRMDPYDPADIHYRVALLLKEDDQPEEARRHVLLALEEAPRYRDAHKLLLSLVEPEESPAAEASPPVATPGDSEPNQKADTPQEAPATSSLSDEAK